MHAWEYGHERGDGKSLALVLLMLTIFSDEHGGQHSLCICSWSSYVARKSLALT